MELWNFNQSVILNQMEEGLCHRIPSTILPSQHIAKNIYATSVKHIFPKRTLYRVDSVGHRSRVTKWSENAGSALSKESAWSRVIHCIYPRQHNIRFKLTPWTGVMKQDLMHHRVEWEGKGSSVFCRCPLSLRWYVLTDVNGNNFIW